MLYYIQVENILICFLLDCNKLEMSLSKLRFQDEQMKQQADVYLELIDLVSLSGTALRPAAINCLVIVH